MQQIVECVPNFSNGRDPAIYNQIADAVRGVAGVHVLDVSADADHNRTVITFVGSPKDVEEAAFRSIATAARLINLDEHRGEHPRIGATDVCPFIPVRGLSMSECVAMAQRLGKRVGDELGVAVYLYGAAATRPDRESLSAIRRGEYELWKEQVATLAERAPDFGPAEPRPWGATVIGARPFLIAYNLYLNSDRDDIAEQIAKSVRFSSGGLRFLQAKGFLVEGQAQVSMNLTNFEKTPLHRVQELVRREAAHYGLTVTRAELVGLIPQRALLDAAKWYLQLDDLRDEQVLESRLETDFNQQDASSPLGFVEATAAATPTPGGGAVAGLAGTLSAALTQMVAGLTVGRKKYAPVNDQAAHILSRAEHLRRELALLIREDSAAFEQVMAVARNKEMDEATKQVLMEDATRYAGEVPLKVARLSCTAAHLAREIAEIGNINAASDAAAGAIMARAAVHIAGLNVKINGVSLQDQTLAAAWRSEVESLLAETDLVANEAVARATERGGL